MLIRQATRDDRDAIAGVHGRAFPPGESGPVARLALELLDADEAAGQSIGTIHRVAEVAGAVVGHVAFSPVDTAAGGPCRASILAPLAVHPDHQRQGIGTGLIDAGLRHLAEAGVNFVLVYGDPAYYGRFGFSAEAGRAFTPPHALAHPHGWQALVLAECALDGAPLAIRCVPPLCDPRLW